MNNEFELPIIKEDVEQFLLRANHIKDVVKLDRRQTEIKYGYPENINNERIYVDEKSIKIPISNRDDGIFTSRYVTYTFTDWYITIYLEVHKLTTDKKEEICIHTEMKHITKKMSEDEWDEWYDKDEWTEKDEINEIIDKLNDLYDYLDEIN